MSNYQRFFIGSIGGLTPVFMFLYAVDFERYFNDTSTLKLIGYCVRVIILFFVGGFVAYLHNDENKPFKLFEIGMGAPALIAGYITTASIPNASNPGVQATANFSIMSSAYAADSQTPLDEIKKFSLPVETPTSQFLEGLLGRPPENVWFVVAGSYQHLENAKAQADKINSGSGEFKASVYEPYADSPNYRVIIGANLTKVEATALQNKAASAGLETFGIMTFQNLPPAEQQ